MELIVGEQNQVSLKFRDDENPGAEFVKLKRSFLDQMNRGGYFYPTELTFSLSLHGWRSFLPLCTHPGGRSVLSDNIDYMEAFVQALMLSLDEDTNTSNILKQSCKSGDSFQPTCKKNVRYLFNIFPENYVSNPNS